MTNELRRRLNHTAAQLAMTIVAEALATGTDTLGALVILEGATVGALAVIVPPSADGAVLDVLATAVRERMASARLFQMPPAGAA